VRHRLEYAAVAALRALVVRLPPAAARAVGSAIGLAFYALDGPHRRLAVANLRAAFPHRPRRECRRTARRTFAHFGRLVTAILEFSALEPAEMLRRVEFEGAERVEQALARGRGALLFTGHFGFWEVHALVHALRLGPIAVVARALDNPLLDALLARIRTTTGNIVVYRRGALRRVLRHLAEGRAVAILIDQHIQSADAVMVDFFDRPAATTAALAAVALRTGAPVIPVFALPAGRGRYRLVYEPPVEPPAPDDPDPVRALTQRCTDVLEMYVRRYPELWLWMHRRWRDAEPAAAPARGMFPAATSD
jgi:KDO2-lipid IV(A) lauroyltransferase